MALLVALIFAVLNVALGSRNYTPIVMYHGLLDTCCHPDRMGKVFDDLKNYLPQVHILNVRIGGSEAEDYLNSVLMHPDKQIEIVCKMIREDPALADGYNGIGVSQGSQLLRGIAQRCPHPPMKKLITLAGQHQGVYGLPKCNATTLFCRSLRLSVNMLVYNNFYQKLIVPATYWHNPINEAAYKRKSSFLADINNERFINQTYVENLQKLEKFVMVKYTYEDVVQPKESSWFGFYKPGQSRKLQTLQESEIYLKERLGLKKMDEEGKLDFLEAPWHHVQYDWNWFRENIVDRYLV